MTVQHFIVTGFRYVWRYIRKPVFFIYDKFFYADFTCSLADLLNMKRGEITRSSFVIASRIIDIRKYEMCDDDTFSYQVALRSYKYFTPEFHEKIRQEFDALIQSVKKNGYRKDSRIFIDKNLYFIDGSHRLGCLYYWKIMEVPVRCFFRKAIYSREIDMFCKLNIPSQMFEDILHECARMQQTFLERGYSFMLWISGNDDEQVRHLIFGLTPFVEVYKTYRIASNTTRYNDGYLVQFTPRNLEYAVTRKGYYAQNVKRIESILSKRIANLGWKQQFAISQNCLEGHTMIETVQAFLKEVE